MAIDPSRQLTPLQAAVVSWRLLMPDGHVMTWQCIARNLGTTEEKVKLAYSAGCSKLRRYAGENYPLKDKPMEFER